MTAILLALGGSVGYGVSGFLASRVAKRVAPVLLVRYSQLLQSVVLLVVVVAVDQPYSAAALGWARPPGWSGWSGWSPTTRRWPPARPRSSPPSPPAGPC